MVISKKEQIANQLINQVKEFPPLPGFINKLMQLNADPNSSLDEISRVVEAEVSLAASVIKLANSPFFGTINQVSSISHAISLLGRNELLNLVLASAMFQTYKGFKEKKQHISALRLHCFRCALIARYLAEKTGQNGGEFFIAGLVHDIGKIIIYLAYSEQDLQKVYRDSPIDHDDIGDEEQNLGIGHNALGCALLASWNFPDPLQVAVEYHHQPELATEHTLHPLIIHVADALIRILDARESGGPEPVELSRRLLAEPTNRLLGEIGLSVTEENLNTLLEEVQNQLDLEADLAEMFT